MVDNGYDISDYKNVDSVFGNIEDFKELVKKFKEHDIKVIIDFVPNHTSDQHEWFQKSCLKIEPYTDYYVWLESSTESKLLPNNWKSVFGGTVWHWNSSRNAFYLHQFYKEQPDLNLRNVNVRRELKNVLKFWLDIGVAGFRIGNVKQPNSEIRL